MLVVINSINRSVATADGAVFSCMSFVHLEDPADKTNMKPYGARNILSCLRFNLDQNEMTIGVYEPRIVRE